MKGFSTSLAPAKIGLLAAVAFASASHAAITDGLVSYWPLNEITVDNTAADAAFSNHLTVNGVPAVSAGQVGNAYTFDGLTTYLSIAHGNDNAATGLPIFRAGSYTVSMWVKGAAQTAKYLFAEGSTASNNPLLIIQTGQTAANNGKLDIIIRNDAGTIQVNHVVSAKVVFDNNWHHVAWVDDKGACKLYIDGVADTANFNYTPAGTYSFTSTAIGTLIRAAISTGNIFAGQIDDVGAWERALTASEVDALKTGGIPTPVPPTPATLTSVPASVTKNLGDWALFSVSHVGTRPFSYQWFKNGFEIPGATAKSYQATGLTVANSGDFYAVKVTNPGGSLTTTNATITVVADPAPDLRRDLVNYWPLDEIQQPATELLSPELYSHNDMVLKGFAGTTDTVPGKFANGLSFDFTTNRYTFRTNGSPIYNATNYTVSMWVNGDFNSQNDRRVFSEGSTANNNPLFTLGTDNTGLSSSATVFIRNDTGVATAVVGKRSTRPVFDATWHHLVWTDANGKGKLYIDGVLDETDYNYTRPALTLNVTALGGVVRAAVSNPYLGAVDEVATWKRVLSWTEIQNIMASGVPAPISIIAPSITGEPLNRTSGVFQGDNVKFSVQTSGTVPFVFEWYRDNVKINSTTNPSAATDTLELNNVAVGDSGSTYFVKVINSAGTATSQTVGLNVVPYTPATSGVVLNVDVGLTGQPNVMSGFDEFTLGINGTNYNAVGLTITGLGTALAERNRIAAPLVVNGPTMTQAQLYNDFIFANSTADGTGLRILIERLAPNTKYGLKIWSFDPQSTGARFANWSETSAETPIDIMTGYTFDGSVQPVNDNDRVIRGLLTSTATGKLQIDAIKAGGASFGAFVNAIRLEANPSIRILSSTFDGTNVRIVIEKLSADQTIGLVEKTGLGAGAWAPADAVLFSDDGFIVTFDATFNPATPEKYYRAVLQ